MLNGNRTLRKMGIKIKIFLVKKPQHITMGVSGTFIEYDDNDKYLVFF